ncbi:MAG TPA: glycolate oxidase subunit GlcF [Steroidobacteraceae bacterium]|nr:glycolate oxidase subunit GlcF [Steroidobacteraceae bacterium]
MKVQLSQDLQDNPDGRVAADIVRSCVHCGFCTATCPTYQVFGDELDGPRGRIYLIKEVLEGTQPSERTQLHLDRCLTCRACETTCPSGVQYGRLLDIGRRIVEEKVDRSWGSRLRRAVLKRGLTGKLFGPTLRLGQLVRPLLPQALSRRIPVRRGAATWPSARTHARRMLLPPGCVQPSLAPEIDVATARVLDALQIQAVMPEPACCGALRHHLGDDALDEIRRTIDSWWPHIEGGVEAIVMNASGCACMVKEYAYLLRHDTAYASKAARIAELTRDLAEVLPEYIEQLAQQVRRHEERVVFHPPCTLQHAQKVRGAVEQLLESLGAVVLPFTDSHLCCGSAGTYSILQPTVAEELRARKLAALQVPRPDVILSANVGCIVHLAGASEIPVRHWVEWIAARLPAGAV